MSNIATDTIKHLDRIRLVRGMAAKDPNPMHGPLYQAAIDDAKGILAEMMEDSPHAKLAKLRTLRAALLKRHARAVAMDDDETAWRTADAWERIEEEITDAREEAAEIGEWS